MSQMRKETKCGSSLFNAPADWMDRVCGADDVMVTSAVVCDSVCVVSHTPLSFEEIYCHVTQSDKRQAVSSPKHTSPSCK